MKFFNFFKKKKQPEVEVPKEEPKVVEQPKIEEPKKEVEVKIVHVPAPQAAVNITPDIIKATGEALRTFFVETKQTKVECTPEELEVMLRNGTAKVVDGTVTFDDKKIVELKEKQEGVFE